MRVASWADRHARSILFCLAALVLGGIVGTWVLPVGLFPHVNFPRIRVNLDAGERPAERMMIEVTRPIEEALRAVPGVRTVHSTSSRGSAEVWLAFDWGEDMQQALLSTESAVNRVLTTLPQGTTFTVRRMDPTVFPVIAYSLTSETRKLSELRDLAQYQLRPVLSTIAGVARIGVDGGAVEEYRILVDPDRLSALKVSFSDVASAISDANVLSAAGRIQDRYKILLVVTDTRFRSIDEIGQTVVKSSASGIVHLKDVATIRRDIAPQFTRATADGRDTVLVNVYQQPGGNTVAIASAIRATLEQERQRLPKDVTIKTWYDQSDLITASAHSVRDAVFIGVILAALVLLLFLRNWRITLIAALAVPVVLAVTALLLYVLNQSFNIMTLGGMAAAVGLIIDDAIVMSEHIVRRLQARQAQQIDPKTRVLTATDEFTKPLTGSSLSTIIIHIPPAFMIGVFGAFFAALSLSMAMSLVISFFVAWLAIPILAAKFLREGSGFRVQGSESQEGRYARFMRRVLSWPWVSVLVLLAILVGGRIAYTTMKTDVMPTVDEGGFVLDYVAPPGTSLVETDRMLQQVEEILKNTPEVDTYSRRTGFSLGGDIQETNMGDFFVRLKGFPRRPILEVMDDVEGQIKKTIPGLDVDLAQLMEDLIGDLTGRPEPIVINLFSEDEKVLSDLANKVEDAIKKIPGVKETKNGIVVAGDSLDIQVDRNKAAIEGVDADMLAKNLTDLLSGNVSTQIQQGEKIIDVRVWVPDNIRRTTDQVARLQLRAPDGHLFPVERVATLKIISGQPEINREDFKRVVSVTGRSERDLGSTIRDVRAVLERPGFIPAGVRWTLGGLYEQQQIAFRGLMQVIIAGAVLVFLLLLFLYESFRVAIAILLTTLTAIAAVFIGLLITGTELNVSSLMGMVMIVGNVTEVAIFYYSEFADFPHEGDVISRLIAAGTYRMRAIVMTTLAAILALLPLALGIGHGSQMLQPLAIAIISGLVVQLPLVLILLPCLLLLFGTKPPTHQSAPVI